MSSSDQSDLVYSVGDLSVRIPRDRMYSHSHHWVQAGPGGFRVGMTDYFLQPLREIYYLEWNVPTKTPVKAGQAIGQMEGESTRSPLFSPATGIITDVNTYLLDDPEPLNSDCYGLGWLYHFDTDARFLTPEAYLEFLQSGTPR